MHAPNLDIPISPATSAFLYSTLFVFVNVAGLIPTSQFGFKEHFWQYAGPTTYNLGGFCGLIVYSRTYADASKLTVLSVNTKNSVISFISGREDFITDVSITDGNLILGGSGTYWGGIRVVMLGKFL